MYCFIMLKKHEQNSPIARYCLSKDKNVFDCKSMKRFKREDFIIVRLDWLESEKWLKNLVDYELRTQIEEQVSIVEIVKNTIELEELNTSVLGFLSNLTSRNIAGRIYRGSNKSIYFDELNDKVIIIDQNYGIRLLDKNMNNLQCRKILISADYVKELDMLRAPNNTIMSIYVGEISKIEIQYQEIGTVMPDNRDYSQDINRKLFKAKADVDIMEKWNTIYKQIKEIKTPGKFVLTDTHLYWEINNVKLEVPESKKNCGIEWSDDYTINLGDFIIKWTLGTTEFFFYNKHNKQQGYNAPHVFQAGNPCFGTFDEIIAQCVELSDIEMLCHTLLRFLAFANPKDTIGRNWVHWARQDGFPVDEEQEEGIECSGCGSYEDEENMNYAEDEYWCDDCYSERFNECRNCGDVHRRDDSYCIYDDTYCSDCYYSLGTTCDNCGDNILDMDVICISYESGEQVYVCKSCHEELECKECRSHDNIVNDDNICRECLTKQEEEDEANTIDESPDQEGISNIPIPVIPEYI